MGQSPPDPVGEQVAALGARMLDRADELADGMTARIRAAVPIYTTGIVTHEQLRATSLANVEFIFRPIGRTSAVSSPQSRDNGRERARAGIPLTAVMAAYRVGARYLWDHLAATATEAAAPAEVVVRAAGEMWLVLDTFTHEMAEGYREEVTAQALDRQQQRSALVQAIVEGHLADTSLWEAAEILRLPARGPYAVLTAAVAEPGRSAVPDAAQRLSRAGIASAWGMTHDAEIGIAALPRPGDLDAVAAAFADGPGRVGVSPRYETLPESADALRLARVALRACTAARLVTVFERQPLAVAAAGTPDVMRRVARTTLEGLAGLPAADRALLLRTFGAWLDHRGSADATATVLHCHPNTVRYRLRRLEEYTGRSLADPRWVAELSLAYHVAEG
ncbi:hypothetical protein F4553_007835 [Allocatelliglobosispora scoriae]|uniref:PucR family transcriptional regulator n=1 Tax=Allocatelliglobosispora scoriae TaxID=643052 RepID=A0A841C6J4_9ACTN|nr:helix-turn-helix domain-containing protein [Allocatelliglobosispora scoriae]MBB5874401.1 hypothetical protein [Allocatelliglobosispora scoriae]